MKPVSAGGVFELQTADQSVANDGTAIRTVSRPSVTVAFTERPDNPMESSASCSRSTVYLPGGTLSKWKYPWLSLVAVRELPVRETKASSRGACRRLS